MEWLVSIGGLRWSEELDLVFRGSVFIEYRRINICKIGRNCSRFLYYPL